MQVIDIVPLLKARQCRALETSALASALGQLDDRIDVVIQSIRRQLTASSELISRLPPRERRRDLEASCEFLECLLAHADKLGQSALDRASLGG